jgi:hypothetical protein
VTNKYTIPNKILFSVSALAALILATGTVAALIAQPAAAQDTSIPTSTQQTQTCDTAGSASSISISCNGASNNNVANSPNPPSAELRCPTGFTLTQGLCIAPVTYECPTDTPFRSSLNLVGTTCSGVTIGGFSQSDARTEGVFCTLQLHGQPTLIPLTAIFFRIQCDFPATAVCPGGITPTGGQCITRPS